MSVFKLKTSPSKWHAPFVEEIFTDLVLIIFMYFDWWIFLENNLYIKIGTSNLLKSLSIQISVNPSVGLEFGEI